ncbi:MAG: thioesterase family protein [Anaerolineae bacterium]|nr:thioesterase family protein [Anaerolineae bacterium]
MSDSQQETRRDYPHFLKIPTRWKDVDIYGHVNNAVYYAYFDTVINQFLVAEGGLDPHNGEVVGFAVETHCMFKQPVLFPDVLDVGLRVRKLGNSSVRYEIGIFRPDHPHPAAMGYFVHVFVEIQSHRPTPIPDQVREALARLIVKKS